MKTIDLHGYTVNDGIAKVESLLCELILIDKLDCGMVKVITGNGQIKQTLLLELDDDWDVEVGEELGNTGVLIIEWNHKD